MKKLIFPVVCIGLLMGAALACGSSSKLQPAEPASKSQKATAAPQNNAQATEGPAPTETPLPAPTEPSYSDPVVLGEISGTGKTVTDDIKLSDCNKAVFYWQVAPASYGSASLILDIIRKGQQNSDNLVNEMGLDVGPDGISGSVLHTLSAGDYYFTSENTEEPWKVKIMCEDGAAPLAEGMEIEGHGNIVTGNYSLPACQKSVFHWSVKPDSHGTAAFIADLCGADCSNLANAMKMDLTAPLEGDSLQAVSAGNYFLTVQNASGQDWQVKWTCKD